MEWILFRCVMCLVFGVYVGIWITSYRWREKVLDLTKEVRGTIDESKKIREELKKEYKDN